MSHLWPYLGDLHVALAGHPALAGLIIVTTSIACGMIVGLERERKAKPAGLRTVALISTGSTIFTLASIYAAETFHTDRARISAQIVTGIGFLGAGAILRERGRIVGLTTGATIWTIAAIGVLVGFGFVVAGLVLSFVVVAMLTVTKSIERALVDPCRWERCQIIFDQDRGKTRIRLRRLLDRYRVAAQNWRFSTEGEKGLLEVRYCTIHPQHRAVLAKLVMLGCVREVRELGPPGPVPEPR